jgi:hypothetical protein
MALLVGLEPNLVLIDNQVDSPESDRSIWHPRADSNRPQDIDNVPASPDAYGGIFMWIYISDYYPSRSDPESKSSCSLRMY